MASDFTLTHLLRRSGEVLDAVEDEDVVLRRRGADDLLLTTVPRNRVMQDALATLSAAVFTALEDDDPSLTRRLAERLAWTSVLRVEERRRLLGELARSAATVAELDTTEPLATTLDRWRRLARLRASARTRPSYETRPVATPDDVDDPSIEKASGIVELPLRVRWHPNRTYDLHDVRQLRRVYEQVLREGNDDDVRRFIDIDILVSEWDRLVLPRSVRRAWAEWLRRHRGLELVC